MRDYIVHHHLSASSSAAPASVFDTYRDANIHSALESVEYLTSFVFYVVIITASISATRLVRLGNASESYAVRALYYLFSFSNEVRFQFEASVQVFFCIVLYTSMMIATFDDDQEELLEFFNTMCYYFFLSTLVYYLYKHSIHYFSFLEAGKGDAKSTSLLSQFLFDALNVVAFTLRFLVLMIRLNIYDAVDDVLDSYYIFMADFEEEEYFSDIFFSLFSTMSFDSDVNDDRSFLLEDEMDFSADLFTVYFLV
jgi:hypothetical protein